MQAMKVSGKKLSHLADEITIYPQVLKNARVKNDNKKKYMEDPEIANAIKKVEDAMEGEGRVLIRPSGTEPLVRVMLEGKDVDTITRLAEQLATLLTERLG
jgi:phosphoglucosamine mutase